MKTSLLVSLILVMNVSQSQSLKIEGIVNDSLSNQPLPNASIMIRDASLRPDSYRNKLPR